MVRLVPQTLRAGCESKFHRVDRSDSQFNMHWKQTVTITQAIKGHSLASGSDLHNNACLNYMSNHVTVYTEDYRRATEILIDHIDASCWDQDLLVYPVLIL